MAFDEQLAARIRECLDGRPDVIEKKMFGGLCFMVRGHMACGIVKDDLMLRVGHEQYEAVLTRPHVRPMDFTGRPMVGMVYVAPAGVRTAAALRSFVTLASTHAESLPEKSAAKAKAKSKRKPRPWPKPVAKRGGGR